MSKHSIDFIKDIIAILGGIITLAGFVWFMATDHQVLVQVGKIADSHEVKLSELQQSQYLQNVDLAVIKTRLEKQTN